MFFREVLALRTAFPASHLPPSVRRYTLEVMFDRYVCKRHLI